PVRARLRGGRRRIGRAVVHDAKPRPARARPGLERGDDRRRGRRRAGVGGTRRRPAAGGRCAGGPPGQRGGGAARRGDRGLDGRRRGPGEFVCVVAADELETSRARAALPARVDHADAVHTAGRAALLVAALDAGRGDAIAEALDDRLHEPFRAPLVPLLAAVRGRLGGLPAYGATLSGAGPSVLVWCERG